MSYRLIIRPEVERDLSEAFDWYEQRRAGLGEEFLREIDLVLKRIEENPLRFAPTYLQGRRALPKRFPYKVYFTVRGETISVVAVVHARRHPQSWQKRIE